MNALTVQNLTKHYPRFTLDSVSFSVEEGSVTGLIGANGAGKSTTIKAILGLISCEGEATAFGVSRKSSGKFKSLVGYAGGGFRYYPQKKIKTVAECVKAFYAEWNGEKFARLLQKYELDENKKIAELSEGMKVKFALALALSHGAKLLILDEPTSGLDPLSREEFCDAVLELVREEGVSVLFSTHITSDLTRIADSVVYLSRGKVLAAEPLNGLLEKYSVAHFEKQPNAPVIGLKTEKEGFCGLIKRGENIKGATLSEPTLDEIMVHPEWERRQK